MEVWQKVAAFGWKVWQSEVWSVETIEKYREVLAFKKWFKVSSTFHSRGELNQTKWVQSMSTFQAEAGIQGIFCQV